MLFSKDERRLMERETKGWLYGGRIISNRVAELIAKDVVENLGSPDQPRTLFHWVAYSGTASQMMKPERRALILAIEEELTEYSSDFRDDVPIIRDLSALKAWAEITS